MFDLLRQHEVYFILVGVFGHARKDVETSTLTLYSRMHAENHFRLQSRPLGGCQYQWQWKWRKYRNCLHLAQASETKMELNHYGPGHVLRAFATTFRAAVNCEWGWRRRVAIRAWSKEGRETCALNLQATPRKRVVIIMIIQGFTSETWKDRSLISVQSLDKQGNPM
jgi:hypothetical protein